MKVIERTAFPLIKVSMKDKSTSPLQLDISFDSPQHYGLEGVEMVTDMIKVNGINSFDICTSISAVKFFDQNSNQYHFLELVHKLIIRISL